MKLPLKHKKQIISFVKQYENLSCPRKIKITVPKQRLVVDVAWREGEYLSIDERDREDIGSFLDYEELYKLKEIKAINKRIEKFAIKVEKFNKVNFKNNYWLWEEILWDFRPERGEKFNFKKVTWE